MSTHYHFKPFIGSSHSWAIARASALSRQARVLDIGAADGAVGAALRAAGFADLTAVEPDAAARSRSAVVYTDVVESIEAIGAQRFDLILLLDVLEHISTPDDFLATVVEKLADNGTLLISVPNIAHWAMRLALLCGRFEPMDRGPLDRTHLQQFTRRRLETMLHALPNLSILNVSGSIVPLEFILPEAIWKNSIFEAFSKSRIAAAALRPSIFAYQFLVEARRAGGIRYDSV